VAELVFREVNRSTWHDLVRLFESPGASRYCWCMAWRPMPAKDRSGPSTARRAAMKRLIDGDVPVGILAYRGGAPIGWCSIAPRETYRPLGGCDDGERVWSIACFFIPRELRGQKLCEALLDAAIAHAEREGAQAIEAYPVDPDSPSYRFMGFVDLFRRHGFSEVGRAGSRRHVMRLSLATR
jgi:GNAT superfamily N-acetyltransferase